MDGFADAGTPRLAAVLHELAMGWAIAPRPEARRIDFVVVPDFRSGPHAILRNRIGRLAAARIGHGAPCLAGDRCAAPVATDAPCRLARDPAAPSHQPSAHVDCVMPAVGRDIPIGWDGGFAAPGDVRTGSLPVVKNIFISMRWADAVQTRRRAACRLRRPDL
ncbi:MAG: hypothetical protein H6945_16935 [Zoogloeaceae bacterium]|nr:hypothetical protein [Rhodocyclaceae bacterium]MCP5237425.1 hypothetical protein [Zoogloeaceae bacterium]